MFNLLIFVIKNEIFFTIKQDNNKHFRYKLRYFTIELLKPKVVALFRSFCTVTCTVIKDSIV